MPDEFEPCPDCAERGLCAWCMRPSLTSEERGDDSTGDGPCRYCGWDSSRIGPPPALAECICPAPEFEWPEED